MRSLWYTRQLAAALFDSQAHLWPGTLYVQGWLGHPEGQHKERVNARVQTPLTSWGTGLSPSGMAAEVIHTVALEFPVNATNKNMVLSHLTLENAGQDIYYILSFETLRVLQPGDKLVFQANELAFYDVP